MEESKRVPHVLIFPFPAQGHINQMLKLAELLCLAGLHVTFLNTQHNHHRLTQFTDVQSRFAHFTGFRLQSISDGFPIDHPRPSGFLCDATEILHSIDQMKQALPKFLVSWGKESGWSPISCIISDGISTFALDVGKELGFHTICFRTISACCFWTYFCYPKLIETGEIPFPENADMDERISNVPIPGMESFLRRRDLPSFFRGKNLDNWAIEYLVNESLNSTRASALVLNTTEELEGPSVSQIRTKFEKVYTIGPLHSLLKNYRRILSDSSAAPADDASSSSSSSGLWEEDRSCLTWLGSQPLKSVLYVSFGSITVLTRTELLEFWHGIVNSGKRFLWVRRPDSITGEEADDESENNIPAELQEGTKDRGFIVKWAPQEEVLAHPAVGGFLTHSGWNSTIESMVAGVPMICWPHIADQPVNSRFVGEVWKVGLDMKDICDRLKIEQMVRDLMDNRREELMKSTAKTADMLRNCVSKGGSSYSKLEELIHDLKSHTCCQ